MSTKQLYEKTSEGMKEVSPLVSIEDIYSKLSDTPLEALVSLFNHVKCEWKGSVSDTRRTVPLFLRRSGLFITYNNGTKYITEFFSAGTDQITTEGWVKDSNWTPVPDEDYISAGVKPGVGTIGYEQLNDNLKQLFREKVSVTNFPDDEDIASVDNMLKFKDREVDTANFQSKGYVILRKNLRLVNGVIKNILTKNMINKPNTIYEIRYNFDLDGETIEINEGCILKFEGGSLNNGILKCNNTIINNANFVVLNNCSFSGTVLSEYVRPEWFGAIGNGIADDSNAIISSINSGCDVLLTDNSIYGFSTFENVFNLNGQKLYSKKKATFRYLNNWIDYNNPNTAYKWIFCFIGNSFEINNIIFDLGNEEWVSRVEVSNEVYMNARKHSLANVIIRKSGNFKVCNCDFIGGIHSLDILNECSYFNVDSCTFSKNTADSLYVTDGSHNGIIQNCHLSDNGDDGYCVNVQDAQYIVGHNITVINCTGSNCQGSLCIASGGRYVSFINVNGNCLRAAPIRVEFVNSDVYGANLGRVTFSGCSIKCKKDGFFSSATTNASIIPVNVVIENCYFYSDTPLTQMFYKGNNYIISNCLLENISLHIFTSNDITFSNNTIIAPNNITCENSKEVKFLSNKFYNSGKILDRILEQRNTEDTKVRRNVNIKNSTVRFIGNQYAFNGELSENQKYFHITLDDYCNNIDFCQIDTDIFQTRNNRLLHISKEGIIDFSKCEVYNLLNINNGQLISDKLTNVISIKVDKELLNLFPWNKKYPRAASANERPKEFDIPSNYSNAIYCDNSNQCYFIYNSIKKKWDKLDTSKSFYTEGNERCAGWGNSRPTKLTNEERDKGYQYFDFNLLKPIWWNGVSWIDSFGNPADGKKQGTTEERPSNVQIGYIYKDTTLGKLILWNGTAWVNLDGTELAQ